MKKPGVLIGCRCPASPIVPRPCQIAKLSEMPYTTPIAAAPRSAARAIDPSYTPECPIDPGAGIACINTALPVTSRPAKSAAVPVPTQTTSRSRPPAGVAGEFSEGLTDLNVYDLPFAVNV